MITHVRPIVRCANTLVTLNEYNILKSASPSTVTKSEFSTAPATLKFSYHATTPPTELLLVKFPFTAQASNHFIVTLLLSSFTINLVRNARFNLFVRGIRVDWDVDTVTHNDLTALKNGAGTAVELITTTLAESLDEFDVPIPGDRNLSLAAAHTIDAVITVAQGTRGLLIYPNDTIPATFINATNGGAYNEAIIDSLGVINFRGAVV